jgi:hypothetical protein
LVDCSVEEESQCLLHEEAAGRVVLPQAVAVRMYEECRIASHPVCQTFRRLAVNPPNLLYDRGFRNLSGALVSGVGEKGRNQLRWFVATRELVLDTSVGELMWQLVRCTGMEVVRGPQVVDLQALKKSTCYSPQYSVSCLTRLKKAVHDQMGKL